MIMAVEEGAVFLTQVSSARISAWINLIYFAVLFIDSLRG